MVGKLEIPPVWLAAFIALVWAQARWTPAISYEFPGRTGAGWALVTAGIALALWAIAELTRARTSPIPRRTPSALVTGGPFAYSRNPIYLGDALALTGWTMVVGDLFGLLAVAAFVAVIQRRFILREEAVIAAEFGAEWEAWSARTRRWL